MKKFFSNRGVWFGFITGGLVITVLFVGVGGFFGYTNNMEFCISCHEMEQNPYQELKKTLHYKNRNGVRVECQDCHVPESNPAYLMAKMWALKDVVHHLLGTIDTPEKFEAHRLEMAERVWAKMEATGSRECHSCHSFDAMVLEEQGRRGRKKHPLGIEEGKTCIECHKGVAHNLPKDYEN